MPFIFENTATETKPINERFVVEKEPSLWEDTLKPLYTLFKTEQERRTRGLAKIGASVVGGAVAFPVSGIVGGMKLLAEGPLEAEEAIRKIQELPGKLTTTGEEKETVSKLMWPIEKIQYAAKWYGDKTFELTNDPILSASVATLVEGGTYIGVPGLKAKLLKSIKAGNIAEARRIALEARKESLNKLKSEPNRLMELSRRERDLKNGYNNRLLFPKQEQIKSQIPQTPEQMGSVKQPRYVFEQGKPSPGQPKFSGVTPDEFIKKVQEKQPIQQFKPNIDPETLARQQRVAEQLKTPDTNIGQPLLKPSNQLVKSKIPPSLEVLKRDLDSKGGSTLSFMGSQHIYNEFIKDASKVKEFAKNIIPKIQKTIDVEGQFKKIDAPETGFHAKNFFSQWDMWDEKTLGAIGNTAKISGYDKSKSGLNTVLAAESQKSLASAPTEIKQVAKSMLDFQEGIRQEYSKRGISLDFKSRIIDDINKLLRDADPSEIPALKKALSTAEDMNFVHIPTAMWIESKLSSPTGSAQVLKLLATQKRKSLNIKSLVDRGIINPEDVNVYDIMASYGRRAGRDFGLLNIVDAAVKEGLASKTQQQGFVKIPSYEAPILSKYNVHPILADYIRNELLGKGINLGDIQKWLSTTKMAAFINPAILPMYDVVQHSMLATFTSPNLKHLGKGAMQYLKRSPEYWEALDNGLASKPYNNPFSSYEASAKFAAENPYHAISMKVLESVMPWKAVKNIYNASWYMAWELDKMIRMGSYNLLKSKGFSNRDAAQIAAKFHSDYASVPASTRRMLNVPFFTPTFKITMGKLYGRMIADSLKSATKIGKSLDPQTKTYAKALAATVAINEAYDLYMTKFAGFKRDEWGRRYVKEIDTDDGKKELTITMSSPHNMWHKYAFRAASSFSPEIAKPWVRLFEQNKWEIQPLFRVAYEIAGNDNGKGDKIYNEFDTRPEATVKALRYATKSVIGLIGLVDRDPSDTEGREEFVKEYGKLTELLIRPFTFTYTRSTEEKRIGWKIKTIQNRFNKMLRRGEIEQKHVKEYINQLNEVMKSIKK